MTEAPVSIRTPSSATSSSASAPGLSPYTIRDLANWYEEEANRRRIGINVDQDALDRDLRRVLAERGAFPEFIAVEFERVTQVVFPGSARNPEPRPETHEERIAALGDVAGTVVDPAARDVLRCGDCCPSAAQPAGGTQATRLAGAA